VARLGLPWRETKEPKDLTLDPLRSPLDRQRHVALQRLTACSVPYGSLQSAFAGATPGGPSRAMADADTLTARWRVHWVAATEAMIELAGLRGVTLQQAAEGTLRAEERRLEQEDKLGASAQLALVRRAADCGLATLTEEGLRAMTGRFLAQAGLRDLIDAHALVQRIERGHVPGLVDDRAFHVPAEVRPTELVAAAIRAVDALSGSDDIDDARALLDLVELHERTRDSDGLVGGRSAADGALGDGRLGWSMDRMAQDGSPLFQGAASAARALMGRETTRDFGVRFSSWLDGGDRTVMAARIRGAVALAAPLLEADASCFVPVADRIEAFDDSAFLARLPALREGFDALSTAARSRLLAVLGERLSDGGDPRARAFDATTDDSPEALAAWASADVATRDELTGAALWPPPGEPRSKAEPRAPDGPLPRVEPAALAPAQALAPRDRWRLILGREREKLPPAARRISATLEELYGRGRGEGSRSELGVGGGSDKPFPTVREWAAEIESLFGANVREEVLGVAAARGRPAAALELDPEAVTPSIELLERVLSLKGGLAEAHVARLRRLVQRVVEALASALANRVRPALTGLAMPRPTRRPVGPVDLRRTIARNLRTARTGPDGVTRLTPERFVFRSRAKRSLDWHLVLVVDVSGSMDASVIYSAMMAAILSAIPALTVHFVAFNTEVLDLSGKVDDPLGLLLEVSVGGGTFIAKGLRYARSLLKVPVRSLVVLLSDFEEGDSVPALLGEVRAIVESGAKAIGLAALDDAGKPRYQRAVAELVVAAGMPVAALTPLELARWVGEQLR
jgi:Mg-chelatase subunit ChlD